MSSGPHGPMFLKHTVSLFTFVVSNLEYRLFYLSPNGKDVSTCGKTYETSCKTLEHVLSLYYKLTHQVGLEIITSKALIIDKKIMVSVLYSCLVQVFFFHWNWKH